MFLVFFLALIGGAIIPVVLFSGGELVGVPGLVASAARSREARAERFTRYGRMVIRVYIWFGWAAYCAWLALRYASAPGVANPSVYLVIAVAATGGPIAYLHLRDRWGFTDDDERTRLQQSSNLWRVMLLFACGLFLIAPQLMSVPYGWFTRLDEQVSGETSRALTRDLHAAQDQIIPSAEHGQPFVPAATSPVLATARQIVTSLRWTGANPTATVGGAPCEREQRDRRDSQLDGPCEDIVEPDTPSPGER